MNLKKLTTLLFAGVTAATPFATNAQNPTILQGNYISNVFGQANFVLNPNAQTNVANVTLTNATATRSTTTPLVATSEWNVTVTSANGTAAWATRSFDAGMKNQNCEARFTYRGFQATSKAQIKQGANVVAELVLTPSATDPRIASINFPCGDLSAATTFVITDSATLSGTHEIGGIYVGLATNQANVAQAETVVLATRSAALAVPHMVVTTVPYNIEEIDIYSEYSAAGIFKAKRAGTYALDAIVLWDNFAWPADKRPEILIRKNGLVASGNLQEIEASITQYKMMRISGTFLLQVGDELDVALYNDSGSTVSTYNSATYQKLSISRFPSSSELVVTPETQNVFASVKGISTGGSSNTVASSSWTKLTSIPTLTRTTFGKAKVESNNDYSITIENMPVGAYYVTVTGSMLTASAVSGSATVCFFGLADSATGGAQIASTQQNSTGDATSPSQDTGINTIGGVYQNTAVANRTFFLQAFRSAGTGGCYAWTDGNRPLTITVIPLDQPSNSALYVQGPVKAAATGTAIPAGYVGEEKIGYATSTSTVSANLEVDVTGTSITLEPGVWDIEYSASVLAERTPASTTSVQCRLRIRDSANNVETLTESGIGLFSNTSDISWNFFEMSKKKRLTLTSTKTYKLSLTASVANTVANCTAYTGTTAGAISGNEATTYIRAIRIN